MSNKEKLFPIAEVNDHLPEGLKLSNPQRACREGVRGYSGTVVLPSVFFSGKYYTSLTHVEKFLRDMQR